MDKHQIRLIRTLKMGGFISTIRDFKVILRDLKITLKFTAKIVLKVHGIVDDVENTVQELKTTVSNLSARVPTQTTSQEKLMEEKASVYLNEVAQCIETTADSVKTSLANAISVLTSDDLLKNTSDAFENLVNHSGTNLSGVMARWASIPDGIGDLVRQDCISLKDYAQSSNVMSLKAKTSEKIDENQLTCKTLSAKVNELDSKDDISGTNDSGNDFELVNMTQTMPKGIVEEISFSEFGRAEILKILKPLSISKHSSSASKWYNIEILPTQANRKCRPERQGNHSVEKPHDMMQTNFFSGIDICPEPMTEFQTEILSLLLMTLVQGFSSENTSSVYQKAVTVLSSSPKCKSVGQALMTEYLPCD